MQELVVPRSIPIVFAILNYLRWGKEEESGRKAAQNEVEKISVFL
jgi:hypothetical protein